MNSPCIYLNLTLKTSEPVILLKFTFLFLCDSIFYFQLNIYDEVPWKYNETRNQFLYAPLRSPLLNFRSENVISEFTKVIKNFVALGASGIRLRNAQFLLVDPEFRDESPSYKGVGEFHLGQYGFNSHDKTEHLPELGTLLYTWRKILKNATEDGPFMVQEDLKSHINSYKVNESLIIDLPLKTGMFDKNNVSEILNNLNYTLRIDNIDWPLWKVIITKCVNFIYKY